MSQIRVSANFSTAVVIRASFLVKSFSYSITEFHDDIQLLNGDITAKQKSLYEVSV